MLEPIPFDVLPQRPERGWVWFEADNSGFRIFILEENDRHADIAATINDLRRFRFHRQIVVSVYEYFPVELKETLGIQVPNSVAEKRNLTRATARDLQQLQAQIGGPQTKLTRNTSRRPVDDVLAVSNNIKY